MEESKCQTHTHTHTRTNKQTNKQTLEVWPFQKDTHVDAMLLLRLHVFSTISTVWPTQTKKVGVAVSANASTHNHKMNTHVLSLSLCLAVSITHTHTHTHTHRHTDTHTHTHTQTHKHTNTHICIHTHTHAPSLLTPQSSFRFVSTKRAHLRSRRRGPLDTCLRLVGGNGTQSQR